MKTITSRFLLPLCAVLVAVASPCLAQSRTIVSFSDGTPCIGSPVAAPAFEALSVSVKASLPKSRGGGAGGPVGFDDIAVTRNVDDCSVSLYTLLVQEQRVRKVTISFQNLVGGLYKETLRMTLTDAFITSIGDTESGNSIPQERVSLSFRDITIFDPVTGKSITH